MAKLPEARMVHALTVALALTGSALVGVERPVEAATPSQSWSVDEPGTPPAPNPDPNVQRRGDPPEHPVPPMRRRHIDNDPALRH